MDTDLLPAPKGTIMTEEEVQKMVEALAEQTPEQLARLYIINLFPAALSGPDSTFGKLQQGIKDEMARRSAKDKGELQ